MGMWRRKPQIQWLWGQCWVTTIYRYCAMSKFDSKFLIPLKFRMPPCVHNILRHPCHKIFSLVSKFCYNFEACLLQNLGHPSVHFLTFSWWGHLQHVCHRFTSFFWCGKLWEIAFEYMFSIYLFDFFCPFIHIT
jgi:hypothetical protein